MYTDGPYKTACDVRVEKQAYVPLTQQQRDNYVVKPDRNTLIELKSRQIKADMAMQAYWQQDRTTTSAADAVDLDIVQHERYQAQIKACNDYAIALELYKMTDQQFAEWQFMNGIIAPARDVEAEMRKDMASGLLGNLQSSQDAVLKKMAAQTSPARPVPDKEYRG